MGIPCFLLERTGRSWRWLRRYTYRNDPSHPCRDSYGHDAAVFLEEGPSDWPAPLGARAFAHVAQNDPRWPSICQRCWAPLDDKTEFQIFTLEQWRGVDTGALFSIHDNPPAPAAAAPVGAMWYADWLLPWCAGPDGRALVVRCPSTGTRVHDWTVDGRASNCTEECVNCGRPYPAHFDAGGYTTHNGCESGYEPRDSGAHRCWVRHGTPPDVTVDKNGLTCRAGAGSIQTPGWHGYLRNGALVE